MNVKMPVLAVRIERVSLCMGLTEWNKSFYKHTFTYFSQFIRASLNIVEIFIVTEYHFFSKDTRDLLKNIVTETSTTIRYPTHRNKKLFPLAY
jgi:hypothetical protein